MFIFVLQDVYKGLCYMSMKLITVHIPEKFLEALDELVAEGRYPNRSEIIRIAIRDFLREELWRSSKKETVHSYPL